MAQRNPPLHWDDKVKTGHVEGYPQQQSRVGLVKKLGTGSYTTAYLSAESRPRVFTSTQPADISKRATIEARELATLGKKHLPIMQDLGKVAEGKHAVNDVYRMQFYEVIPNRYSINNDKSVWASQRAAQWSVFERIFRTTYVNCRGVDRESMLASIDSKARSGKYLKNEAFLSLRDAVGALHLTLPPTYSFEFPHQNLAWQEGTLVLLDVGFPHPELLRLAGLRGRISPKAFRRPSPVARPALPSPVRQSRPKLPPVPGDREVCPTCGGTGYLPSRKNPAPACPACVKNPLEWEPLTGSGRVWGYPKQPHEVRLIEFLGSGSFSRVYRGANRKAYTSTEPGDLFKRLLPSIVKHTKTAKGRAHLPKPIDELGTVDDGTHDRDRLVYRMPTYEQIPSRGFLHSCKGRVKRLEQYQLFTGLIEDSLMRHKHGSLEDGLYQLDTDATGTPWEGPGTPEHALFLEFFDALQAIAAVAPINHGWDVPPRNLAWKGDTLILLDPIWHNLSRDHLLPVDEAAAVRKLQQLAGRPPWIRGLGAWVARGNSAVWRFRRGEVVLSVAAPWTKFLIHAGPLLHDDVAVQRDNSRDSEVYTALEGAARKMGYDPAAFFFDDLVKVLNKRFRLVFEPDHALFVAAATLPDGQQVMVERDEQVSPTNEYLDTFTFGFLNRGSRAGAVGIRSSELPEKAVRSIAVWLHERGYHGFLRSRTKAVVAGDQLPLSLGIGTPEPTVYQSMTSPSVSANESRNAAQVMIKVRAGLPPEVTLDEPSIWARAGGKHFESELVRKTGQSWILRVTEQSRGRGLVGGWSKDVQQPTSEFVDLAHPFPNTLRGATELANKLLAEFAGLGEFIP